MQTLTSGTLLMHGTYQIESVLGQGGFGITYLATDLNLERTVAIKEFFPKDYCDRNSDTCHVTLGTQHTAEFVGRLKEKFLKEARNIAKFDCSGIIKIHAAFEENNTAYYVMDFIEGESLSAMVKRGGPLSEAKALRYIEQVGHALEYIHEHRINHLDVKPANIMVRRRDDAAILIDFGLSKQYDSEGHQTSTTPTGISHGFAPMEQYNDGGVREFSPQTDLYSLAATLYYALSGIVPPQATRLIDEDLTFPDSIPTRLISPISKAMSNARRHRHATLNHFFEEILNKAADNDDTVLIRPEAHKSNTSSTIDDTDNPKILDKPEKLNKFPISNRHEGVDLGLSVKWAACNIGASDEEECGDYFAWGAIEPYKERQTFVEPDLYDISGNPKYDAATSIWGGDWRMPTKKEFDELIHDCSWARKTRGRTKGCEITGPSGEYIFLPLAGYKAEWDDDIDLVGDVGEYWSSTRDKQQMLVPWELCVDDDDLGLSDSPLPEIMLPIRPVIDYTKKL